MPKNFDHTRSDILDLARTNNIVNHALQVCRIAGIKDSPFVWERALILAVVELVKANDRLTRDNFDMVTKGVGGTQITVDFGTLNEDVKRTILAPIKAKGESDD